MCVRKSESDRERLNVQAMFKNFTQIQHEKAEFLSSASRQNQAIQQKKQNFMSGYDSTVGVAECCTCLFSITDENSNLSVFFSLSLTHTHSNIQTQQGVAHIELWRLVMIVFADPQLTCRHQYHEAWPSQLLRDGISYEGSIACFAGSGWNMHILMCTLDYGEFEIAWT